jgi:hypothetical protein
MGVCERVAQAIGRGIGVVEGWPRLLGEGLVLWKGALAIGGGTVGAAMAIVTSALMSDYQNYVPLHRHWMGKEGMLLKGGLGSIFTWTSINSFV